MISEQLTVKDARAGRSHEVVLFALDGALQSRVAATVRSKTSNRRMFGSRVYDVCRQDNQPTWSLLNEELYAVCEQS